MPNPKINPVILLSPMEDSYIAYDPALDRLHELNPVAALLAELCDGSRSVETIRGLAGPLMPDGQAEAIDRWIDEGIKAGLLVWEGGDGRRTPSAKEQSRLALRSALFAFRRLEQRERIDSAYLAAKNSVHADPADWNAWYNIGKIAQCLGRRDEARAAYRKYAEAHPEDGEIEQILISLKDEPPPPRVSDRTVRKIFGNFAASYDARMRDDLKYAGPEHLRDAVNAVIGGGTDFAILDLGCGSGLAGASIRAGLEGRAAEMIGIDLSPEMVELARARNVYDRLEVAEITEWLERDRTLFDIVICCDCLIYFGDLQPVVRLAAGRLKPDGLFALSMERGNLYPFGLAGTGRYTHHPDHVGDVAAHCGLEVTQMSEGFLRLEYGEEVTGLFAILKHSVRDQGSM